MNKVYLYVLLAVSVAGIAMVANTTPTVHTTSGVVSAIAPIMGHVSLTVQDDSGMIKQYVESDNVIVADGKNCLSKLLFSSDLARAASPGSGVCEGALTQPFTYIAVGSDNTDPTAADTALGTPVTDDGFVVKPGSVTWTNATGTTGAEVTIAQTFTARAAVGSVVETGLFNDAEPSTRTMFARNTFSTVALTPTDVLTVEWNISMGN